MNKLATIFIAIWIIAFNASGDPKWLPHGLTIPSRTISPDGRYGVTVAKSINDSGDDNTLDTNQLIEMKTHRVIANIAGPSGWEDDNPSMKWGTMEAIWSKDSSVLCWIYPSKWFPESYVMLKVHNGKVLWQRELMWLAQKEILGRTEAAAPKNFAVAKYDSAGDGGAYPEGFSVTVSEPDPGFALPQSFDVFLTSDIKGSDEQPDEDGVLAWMTMTMAADGNVTYSKYRVKAGKLSPDAKTKLENAAQYNPLIDTDRGKALLFGGMRSKDGRYAIGWAVRPARKGLPEVDWSKYDPHDPEKLLRQYDWENYGSQKSVPKPYEAVDFVIYLKTKATVELPTDQSYWPTKKNEWNMSGTWCTATDGRQYGLITTTDGVGDTSDFWLATITGEQMTVKELAPQLREAVNELLRDRRPEITNQNDFEIVYELDSATKPDEEGICQIPFIANVGDSGEREYGMEGTVALRLSDATVVNASSKSPRLDPFKDNAELRTADATLNNVYQAKLKSLTPAKAEELKKKQQAWITQRDADAEQAVNITPYDSKLEAFEQARENSLLDSTKKRIADLSQTSP